MLEAGEFHAIGGDTSRQQSASQSSRIALVQSLKVAASTQFGLRLIQILDEESALWESPESPQHRLRWLSCCW